MQVVADINIEDGVDAEVTDELGLCMGKNTPPEAS